MLAIGCGFIYSPTTLLEAFHLTEDDASPACQFAVRAGFTSDVTVGCLGLYSIYKNDPDIRRAAILTFFVDQATFLWSALVMGKHWMLINLLPVEVNVLIGLLLLLVPESVSEESASSQGMATKNKKD